MQYILTKEEYEALTPKTNVEERDKALNEARMIILRLSEMPCGESYCDYCPISYLGGKDDEYRPSHEITNLICTLNKRYGK